jgi:hypothetical protein
MNFFNFLANISLKFAPSKNLLRNLLKIEIYECIS